MALGIKYSEFRGGPKDGEICLAPLCQHDELIITTVDVMGKPLREHLYRITSKGHFVHAEIRLPGGFNAR